MFGRNPKSAPDNHIPFGSNLFLTDRIGIKKIGIMMNADAAPGWVPVNKMVT